MMKLYKLLKKTKSGEAVIRFVKFILKAVAWQFAADIEASMIYQYTFGGIKFRGQFFQDMIAYLYLKEKKDGFYVDIGANDGISCSNTYALEKMGWKGACIEPQPDIFKKLRHFRECDCYNTALSSLSGDIMEFIKVKNFNELSGFSEWMTEENKKAINESGDVERINITTKTFDDIMKNYPGIKTIDFMSLDVEGYELNILKSIDFQAYNFRFITVEENEHGDEITALMSKNGYKYLMRAGIDMMFVPDMPPH
jgi:FkbM family methyltransferase